MKYSSSIRLINIIVFLLLAAGFGFLGVWFGFVYGPHMLIKDAISASIELPEISVGLDAMLSVLGFAAGAIAVYGLVKSIRSFLPGGTDKMVRDGFCAYIAIGYVIAVFFFLNATWLYRLTSTNIGDDDIAFVIIVYVILFLVAMIASNVPLTIMFGEGNHVNEIMKTISGALAAITLSTAVYFFTLLFANIGNNGSLAFFSRIMTKIGVLAGAPLLAGVLSLVAWFRYDSCEKHGQVSKLNAYLFESSLAVSGLAIAGAGVFANEAYYNKVYKISFMAKTFQAKFESAYEFAGMSYGIGAVILIVALVLFYFSSKPQKSTAAY